MENSELEHSKKYHLVDVADYVRCIASAGYFEANRFTDEDLHRTAQYAANAQRKGKQEDGDQGDPRPPVPVCGVCHGTRQPNLE